MRRDSEIMTRFSQDIIDNYPIRFGRREKGVFRLAMQRALTALGYAPRLETLRYLRKNRNITVGNVKNAKVILTAHYDTPSDTVFPNILAPLNIPLSVLLQCLRILGIVLLMAAFCFAGGFAAMAIASIFGVLDETGAYVTIGGYAGFAAVILLLTCFPNRRNLNDNTSGVTALIETAAKLPPELRKHVCFVFFDNAECGLLGSGAFKKKYSKCLDGKIIINCDTLGLGDNLLFTVPASLKNSESVSQRLTSATQEVAAGAKTVSILPQRGALTISDRVRFKNAIGVTAAQSGLLGELYISRIHTGRDNLIDRANIELFSDIAVCYIKKECEK